MTLEQNQTTGADEHGDNADAVNDLMANFSSKSELSAMETYKQMTNGKDKAEPKEQQKAKSSTKEEDTVQKETKGQEDKKDEDVADEGKKSDSDSKEDYEILYKKLQKDSQDKEKRSAENLRYSRQLSNALAHIKKHISSLEENGDIDEDTAKSLLEIASKSGELDKLEVVEKKDVPKHIQKMTDLMSKAKDALEKYIEVAPNSESEQKYAKGFDMHLSMLDEDERNQLISTLEKKSESPKNLLKEMLDYGKEFWETPIGKGLDEHGNFIDLVYARDSHIEELNKKIETLEKKLRKDEAKDSFLQNSPAPAKASRHSKYSAEEMMRSEFEKHGMGNAFNNLAGVR